jgi:cysteine-rich repeat protein
MYRIARRPATLLVPAALVLGSLVALVGAPSAAARPEAQPVAPTAMASDLAAQAAAERLALATGGRSQVSFDNGTGTARFVRLPDGAGLQPAGKSPSAEAQAQSFFAQYGDLFGITDAPHQLRLDDQRSDEQGRLRLTYRQEHEGLPVFAGLLRAHFDAQGRLTVVNGLFVPDIGVPTTPEVSAQEASRLALADTPVPAGSPAPQVAATTLMVFRTNLARGTSGTSHLVWELELSNGADVREFVYIDAHDGGEVDRISGIHEGLDRMIYDGPAGGYNAMDPTANVLRKEGDAPTGDVGTDNLYDFAGEVYTLFFNTFGVDGYDGQGATMRSVKDANRAGFCPNAAWNSVFTQYCTGTITDDIVAHEWGHAYTEHSHNLIYQWQPGGLNESYSDIWGELVDLLNESGLDQPNTHRGDGACSIYRADPLAVSVSEPVSLAGDLQAGSAAFGPRVDLTGLSGEVVMANPVSACTALSNAAALVGKIVLMEAGGCQGPASQGTTKVKLAQSAGAIGVIYGSITGESFFGLGGTDDSITIPTLTLGYSRARLLKTELAAGRPVRATLRQLVKTGDDSYRWLMGEESTAFSGAIRDGWNPNCNGDPGKVSELLDYHCLTADGGGVHSNSGVSNHAFALLVDGGGYNGQTISGIGPLRAAHIYFRAMATYQGPGTDFADHADSLEQACRDLIGVELKALVSGEPSGQRIATTDCEQLAKVVSAVEFRREPAQCGFLPQLSPAVPPLCDGAASAPVYNEDFEAGDGGWTVSQFGVANAATFRDRDWRRVTTLPDKRPGASFWAPNPMYGSCNNDNQTGAVSLESPEITLPTATGAVGRPVLSFLHWFATQANADGANLKVQVNDGRWQSVAPEDFLFNGYRLITSVNNNPSPGAAEFAFIGTDAGSVSGSWGESRVDLSRFAKPGDRVRLRFDLASNCNNGLFGWYVDDVRLAYCSTCGNGALDSGEVCDDGNAANGDGCSQSCRVELAHACTAPVAAVEAVRDGGFELAAVDTPWAISGTNTESVLCRYGDCRGSLAQHGDGWARFGFDQALRGTTRLAQDVTFVAGAPQLSLSLMAPTCNGTSYTDTLKVAIDGRTALTVTARNGTPVCGRGYVDVAVDVAPYADGQRHELSLESSINVRSGFVVDKVSAAIPARASTCTRSGPMPLFLPALFANPPTHTVVAAGDRKVALRE